MDSRQNQSSQLPQPLDATKIAIVGLTRLHQQQHRPQPVGEDYGREGSFFGREKHGSFKRPLATS